jgi:hypothetical protein
MATRSTIACKLADGNIQQVYCHWDGYPSNNGVLLLENYNSQELAEAVTSIGDISSLAKSIDKPAGHTFETPADGFTVFYGRDRGEKNTGPRVVTADNARSEESNYLWDGEKWTVDGEPLTMELCLGEDDEE